MHDVCAVHCVFRCSVFLGNCIRPSFGRFEILVFENESKIIKSVSEDFIASLNLSSCDKLPLRCFMDHKSKMRRFCQNEMLDFWLRAAERLDIRHILQHNRRSLSDPSVRKSSL